MNQHEQLLDLIDQLRQEAQSARMAQTVQRSAYMLLARHLAKLKLVQPHLLAADLRQMAHAHPDEEWQAGHLDFAVSIQIACAGP